MDNWKKESLFKIEKNNKYFFESSFISCPNNFTKEECIKRNPSICRNEFPDLLGQVYTFNFKYNKDDVEFKISLRKDIQSNSVQDTNEELDFALGVYSLFIYFEFFDN